MLLIYRCYGSIREVPPVGLPGLAQGTLVRFFTGTLELVAIVVDRPGALQAFVEEDVKADPLGAQAPLKRSYVGIPAAEVSYCEATPVTRPAFEIALQPGVLKIAPHVVEELISEPVEQDPDPPEALQEPVGGEDGAEGAQEAA